jgi:SAM-dependent methyltransferase
MFDTTKSACPGDIGEGLSHWLAETPGSALVERESRCVEEMLSDLFGYYLLQIGWSREFDEAVAKSPIRYSLIMEAQFPGMGRGNTVIGEDRAFPVATDSVDAVFLPHTLDFAVDPHRVLREAERVLIPEGRVVVLGFNPWSTWGLWRLLRHRSGRVPWCGTFLRPGRVVDWLSLLGFDIELQRSVMFLPPVRRATILRQLEVLEPLGRRWLPMLSGVYAIRAVKRVSTLTPLEPRWKARSRVLPGQAVEPTARGQPSV